MTPVSVSEREGRKTKCAEKRLPFSGLKKKNENKKMKKTIHTIEMQEKAIMPNA